MKKKNAFVKQSRKSAKIIGYMTLILLVFMLTLLVIEGLGIFSQTTHLSYCYFVLPICLLIFSLIKKKPIRFPTVPSIFFILFLIFSLISSLNFSLDKQISFEWWLFYFAIFLIFVFFYNFKSEAEKIIKLIIKIATVIFITGFLLKTIFPSLFLIKNIPLHELNLFFSFFTYNHNHLGNFLGLILLIILYKFQEQGNKLLSGLFFILLIIFLYSFSRSAYLSLSLIIGIFLLWFHDRHIKILLLTVIFFMTTFFFLISSPYGKYFYLPQKNLFDSRINYWRQGVQAIKEKPIFGFGMGNFGYVSQKYRNNYQNYSDTSHNILLNIAVENGLLAVIPLIIFMILILRSVLKKRSVFSLLFFYLFLVFQTDYIYQMYSIMTIFMILAAIVYEEEKNETENTIIFGIFAFFLYLVLQAIIISHIFIKNNYFGPAIQIYPLNKQAYPLLIQKQLLKGDLMKGINTANQYKIIAPKDEVTIQTLGLTYELLGMKEKALSYYKQICYLNKYCHPFWIKKTASLINDLYLPTEVFKYLKDRINAYKETDLFSEKLESETETAIQKICLDLTSNKECYLFNIKKLKYFYEPVANTIKKEIKKPYKAMYTINKDTLNERFNYPTKKEKDIYRIMILGDSLAYGQFVDTNKNWTELLEDKLNKDNRCPNIKKIEVINLGVDGYDIEYTVERYKTRGKKYNPDLIIWPIRSFYRVNELIERKIKYIKNNNKEKLNEDEIWEKAKDEVKDELGYETMRETQKKQLNLLPQSLFKKIVFIDTGEINKYERKVLPSNSKILEAIIQDNEYYPNTGVLNSQAHEIFSEKIFDYLKRNYSNINTCLKP